VTDTDTPPPEPTLKPAKRPLWDRISIVWIVPFLALAVVIAIAWQSYADRGPLIEIGFDNASGIRAGNTELRFRDVRVGLVEEVTFSERSRQGPDQGADRQGRGALRGRGRAVLGGAPAGDRAGRVRPRARCCRVSISKGCGTTSRARR